MDKNIVDIANNFFSTRDLELAAVLLTLRFRLIGIDFQQEGTRNNMIGYFKFEYSKNIEEAKMKFMSSVLSVEPKLLFSNLASLKAEVSNQRNSPHNSLNQGI